MDYEVHRCSRHCAVTGRELAEGEAFYSALVVQAGKVSRLDVAPESWAGPPDDCLGWWKSQVPKKEASRPRLAPNDVLLRYFNEVESLPEQRDVLYVLALLLIRRRVLRLEHASVDEAGREVLELLSPRDETLHRVVSVMPSDERVAQIQSQLQELLFAGAA